MHNSGRLALALLGAVVLATAMWLVGAARTTDDDVAGDAGKRIWIVDAGFASRYPQVVRAIADAGGDVRIFDFPGATLPNGNRYVWARDYGPLPMPLTGKSQFKLWDAYNGGSATAELEHEALPRLARVLGVPIEALDIEVQGGNWLPLPDGRVLTTTRFLDDNRRLGGRAELEALLARRGVRGLVAIPPLPGELTQHADMVVAVHPLSGDVFVADLWQRAIDLVPSDPGWDMYREMAIAMRASLDRTAAHLRDQIGDARVLRFPQPLPYLDPHPTADRYRPTFPSFVNGIFVIGAGGGVTYLYALSGDPEQTHYYAFDVGLRDDYRAEVARVASARGFAAVGVETAALIVDGGSLHCATVEVFGPAAALGRARPPANPRSTGKNPIDDRSTAPD